MNKENKNEEKKEFKSSYPKSVRVMAIVGIVILVIMYLFTLVAALTTSPSSPELFKMSVGASILLPIILWVYMRIAIRTSKGARKGAQEMMTKKEAEEKEKEEK